MLVESFQFRLILNLLLWIMGWSYYMLVHYLAAIAGGLVDHLCMQHLLGLMLIACKLLTAYGIHLWDFLQFWDVTASVLTVFQKLQSVCASSRKYAPLDCGCMHCTRFTGEISIFLARSRKFISKCSSLPFTTLSLVSFHGWCTPLGLSACRTFVKPCWKVSIIISDYELLVMKTCPEA